MIHVPAMALVDDLEDDAREIRAELAQTEGRLLMMTTVRAEKIVDHLMAAAEKLRRREKKAKTG